MKLLHSFQILANVLSFPSTLHIPLLILALMYLLCVSGRVEDKKRRCRRGRIAGKKQIISNGYLGMREFLNLFYFECAETFKELDQRKSQISR